MIEPVRDARPSLPAVRADDPRTAAEAVLFEIRRVIVGQDAMLERVLVAAARRRPPPPRGRPGPRQDAHDQDPRRRPRRLVPADPVHAGPRPGRPRRDPHLPPRPGHLRHRARARSSATSCWPTRSTAPRPRSSPRCSRSCRSARSRSGRESYAVPRPFLVMATQNPIESEGTYPLPEAQVDRFMMKVVVGYPSAGEEAVVVERSLRPAADVAPILDRRRPRRAPGADRRRLRRPRRSSTTRSP